MFVAKPLLPRPAVVRLAVSLILICSFTACKKDAPAATDTAASPAVTKIVAPPAQAVSAKVVAMSADQLREAASAALREQRLYGPSGDNAMEYYVALRDKQPNDPAVASALTDLMPYALIATEQSIGRDDFVEAQRLYALMEKADAQAPALPRLKQTIADAQASLAQRTAAAAAAAETDTEEETARKAELEKQRELQQQQQQQQAAQQLAQQQTAEREAARLAAERTAAATAAAARPAPQPAAPAPPPAAAPAPANTASSELRPISTPGPEYPREAQRARESGEVTVEFTVGTDGSVSSARVVRASPPRTFDRAALSAVNRWRFQPVSSPVTSRRTFAFNPGN